MPRIDKADLVKAVNASRSWAEVCRRLGRKPATGSQTHLRKVATKYGINFAHFTGQSWAKNNRSGANKSVEEYLQSTYIKTHKLKLKLFDEGLKERKCERCGNTHWMGEEIPFHLDHINRDNTDWRLENLQVLCPNCHSIKTRKERASGCSRTVHAAGLEPASPVGSNPTSPTKF